MFQELRSKLAIKIGFAHHWAIVILNFFIVLICLVMRPHMQKTIYDEKGIIYYEHNFSKKYCLSKPL